MKVINLTPHDVTVRLSDGKDITYPATGIVATVARRATDADPLPDGCPTCYVDSSPAIIPCMAYELARGADAFSFIVSTVFATSYREHGGWASLLVPDSGPSAIRENGRVVAVRRLIRS